MRKTRGTIAVLLVLFLPSLLFAIDVTGKWRGPMKTGEGEAVFTLKSNKDVVTGSMLGPEAKEFPITEGKLDGDNISLTVAFEWQGQPVTLVATGKVTADAIQLHIASADGYWATDATLKRDAK